MDKRSKRRVDALRTKLQKLEQLLSAAKRQPDDLAELASLERQVAETRAEIAKVIEESK